MDNNIKDYEILNKCREILKDNAMSVNTLIKLLKMSGIKHNNVYLYGYIGCLTDLGLINKSYQGKTFFIVSYHD